MLGTALIVFREVLEASLIVGIVGAATRGIAGRGRWIAIGLALGIVGSLVVAASAGAIAGLAEGMGQELFNASILGLAVVMLAWHNIWMSVHGRELAADAEKVGGAIRDGTKALSVLAVVVLIAVLREGSETVLFLYGIAISGESSPASMAIGGLVGLAGGISVGWLLFAGLLRIPLKWFFSATSVLVLLLAAGLASQAARLLIQANVIPSFASPVWDTSSIVSNSSLAGKALQGLVGYDAQPAAMQVAFFVTVAAVIVAGMYWARRRSHSSP
ncbi:MAG TPA: FTR1 family protein [Usitatibacter sp.]|nr:FTR1 family protein [Usitatibacter sp.]